MDGICKPPKKCRFTPKKTIVSPFGLGLELLKQFSLEAFDEMHTSRAVHLVLIFNTLASFLDLQSLHSSAASWSVSQSMLASLLNSSRVGSLSIEAPVHPSPVAAKREQRPQPLFKFALTCPAQKTFEKKNQRLIEQHLALGLRLRQV